MCSCGVSVVGVCVACAYMCVVYVWWCVCGVCVVWFCCCACVYVVCDLETSRMGAPYIYDISSLKVNDVFNVK